MSKPRYKLAADENQQEIVNALEKIGCSVFILGTPVDLLVGFGKRNFLIEVKSRNTDYGKKDRGTPTQRQFFTSWRGQVRKVWTAEEAIKLVTEAYGRKIKTRE